MKIPIKLGTKKGYQLCIKLILFIVVIAIYFIVLLRESFAAWESTKTKRGNNNSRNNNNAKVNFILYFHSAIAPLLDIYQLWIFNFLNQEMDD